MGVMKPTILILLIVAVQAANDRVYNKDCPAADSVSVCARICDNDADCFKTGEGCCKTSCGSTCLKLNSAGTFISVRPEFIVLTAALTYLKIR